MTYLCSKTTIYQAIPSRLQNSTTPVVFFTF